MEHQHDRLGEAGALLLQDGFHAATGTAERPERVDDAGRPVDAGDEAMVIAARHRASRRPSRRRRGWRHRCSRRPCDSRSCFSTPNASSRAPEWCADDAQGGRLDGSCLGLHGGQQADDGLVVDAGANADRGDRDSPVASSTAFCLAVEVRPRNSLTNSRTVRSRPWSASWAR